jgi:hypothetical protein
VKALKPQKICSKNVLYPGTALNGAWGVVNPCSCQIVSKIMNPSWQIVLIRSQQNMNLIGKQKLSEID